MLQPTLIDLPKITDARGNLSFVEGGNHIPFAIKRLYYLYDVPGGQERGSHAHKNLWQLMIPLSGSFNVTLFDGETETRFHLNSASKGLLIPPGYWRTLEQFTSGSVCVVLASEYYSDEDYIREMDAFLAWKRECKTKAQTAPVCFLDVGYTYRTLKTAMDEAYARVASSGHYIMGPELEAFEQAFAQYCGAKHCLGVGNGMDALTLSLRAWNIGPGDEVLVPAQTFIASWLAVAQVGATPVPVDIAPHLPTIDPAKLEAALTPHTRAIMPVHLYGHVAPMEEIHAFAAKNGLYVLEDAAQAHGAGYRGQRAGSLGHAAGFSFYPGKNLGAFGDGGAIVTNDDTLYARLKSLRNYGSAKKYVHDDLYGVNSRLDEMQAAFLRAKLSALPEWTERRREIARHYLGHIDNPAVTLPAALPGSEPVWHLFAVRTHDRAGLQAHLEAAGVQTLVHYPETPMAQAACRAYGYRNEDYPEAAALARECLSLPIGPHLTLEDAARVAEAVNDFCAETTVSPSKERLTA